MTEHGSWSARRELSGGSLIFHHSIPPSLRASLPADAIFDQLKKDDPQLRLIAVLVLGGLSVLLAGLWWVQVVSARDYQANLETQSFRTVRIPAVRGKILDRNGDYAGGEPAHLQR